MFLTARVCIRHLSKTPNYSNASKIYAVIFDIDVVCEGIEAKEQLNCALSVNTDFVQGHYYSYVYPIDEAQSHYLASKD